MGARQGGGRVSQWPGDRQAYPEGWRSQYGGMWVDETTELPPLRREKDVARGIFRAGASGARQPLRTAALDH